MSVILRELLHTLGDSVLLLSLGSLVYQVAIALTHFADKLSMSVLSKNVSRQFWFE